jgi:hypothetical protein
MVAYVALTPSQLLSPPPPRRVNSTLGPKTHSFCIAVACEHLDSVVFVNLSNDVSPALHFFARENLCLLVTPSSINLFFQQDVQTDT